jgi:hypothetical protein
VECCSLRITGNQEIKLSMGRAMAQAVSHRPLTAEARVRNRVSPCGICSVRSGTETGFLRVLRVSPVNIIPPWFSVLVYHMGMNNMPVGGNSPDSLIPPT